MKGDYTEIRANSNVVTEFNRSKKIIRYPRVLLTSAALNSVYENGYKVTFSHENTSYRAWEAFDHQTDSVGWYSGGAANTTYLAEDGIYDGTTRLATETVLGEWIGLELPEVIKLKYLRLVSQSYDPITNTIDDFVIYAKKQSGDKWTSLGTFTNIAGIQYSAAGAIINIDTMDYYKFFALVATKSGIRANGVSIRALQYFGTPEYDSDAHGTDVTIKSVPDIPNTDWLEVYYDGQDYTSMPTTVTDKSGNNHTGTPTNVGFDTDYKAFTFGGGVSAAGISTTSTATLSYHTASMWMKFNSPAAWEAVYAIRPVSGTSDRNNIILYVNSTYFRLETPGNTGPYYDFQYDFSNYHDSWVHLTVVFRGTGLEDCEMYINSVKLRAGDQQRSSTDNITITGNNTISVGADPGSYYLDGSIANFRLFNRDLTADEIYKLYAYQKEYFGHGDLSMTLKAGRLGIGTSEPRATLDVSGGFQCGNSPLQFYVLYGTHPDPLQTQNVELPPELIGTSIVSITGVTFQTNGDCIPFERHSESSTWEVDVYYNFPANRLIISGQGASGCAGKHWRILVVTTHGGPTSPGWS
jgi:hypothetical protein